METDRQFKGILIGDAFEKLHEGLAQSYSVQFQQFTEVVDRELNRSETFRRFFKLLGEQMESDPIQIYFGKCSCAFVDNYSNFAFDFDDLNHFLVDLDPVNGGVTQAEILLHVLEERMLMRNDTARYDESHLACFKRDSYQNQWRREMGAQDTISFFDKDMDEVSGQFTFVAYDRSGRIFRYPKIEGSKSVFIEQWKDYKPSNQYEIEEKEYLLAVDTNMDEGTQIVMQQSLTGSIDKDRKLKLLHWIGEAIRAQQGGTHAVISSADPEARELELASEIEARQLHVLGPILMGKSVLKAWGSLVSRVKFCNDVRSFEPWVAGAEKAIQTLHAIVRKELESEPSPINTKWNHVQPHAIFLDNIASKVTAYVELVKSKCVKFGLAVPEQTYFDSIAAGAITGKAD